MNQKKISFFDRFVLQRRRLILGLTALTAISAILAIAGEYFGPRIFVYIFKPLTTGLIITMAAAGGEPKWKFYRVAIVFGLCFSLVGDSLLMLPSDKFALGLISFFLTHVLYIAAFGARFAGPISACFAALCAAYGGLMMLILYPRLEQMKLPVVIYMLAILTMAWRAFNRWAANRKFQQPGQSCFRGKKRWRRSARYCSSPQIR